MMMIKGKAKDIRKLLEKVSMKNMNDFYMNIDMTEHRLKSQIMANTVIGNIFNAYPQSLGLEIESDKQDKVHMILARDTSLERLNKLLKILGDKEIAMQIDTTEIEVDNKKYTIAQRLTITTDRKGEVYTIPTIVSEFMEVARALIYPVSINIDGTRVDRTQNAKVVPKATFKTSVKSLKEAIEKYNAYTGSSAINIAFSCQKDGLYLKFGNEKDLATEYASIPLDGEYDKAPENTIEIPISNLLIDAIDIHDPDEDIFIDIHDRLISLRFIEGVEGDNKCNYMHITDVVANAYIDELTEEEEEETEESPEEEEEEEDADIEESEEEEDIDVSEEL